MEEIVKVFRWFLVIAAVVVLGLPNCSLFRTPVALVSLLGQAQFADDFATTGKFTLAAVPIGLDKNVVKLSGPSSVSIVIDSTIPAGQQYTVSVSSVGFSDPISGKQALGILFDGGRAMATGDPSRDRVYEARQLIRAVAGANPADEIAIADLGVGADADYYLRILSGFLPATETLALFAATDPVTDTGRTPLYTSLVRYLAYADTAAPSSEFSRKLLVFAAGRDSTSLPGDNLAAVIASANAKSIPLNVIGIGSEVDDDSLGKLASATHGYYIHSANLNDEVAALGYGLDQGYNVVTASFSPVPPSGTIGNGRLIIDATGSASTALRVRIP
jgi:hypothetical protein